MVGRRVREHLKQLVESSLLQPLHVVFHSSLQRQLVLIEVDFVPGREDDEPIVMEELSLSDLVGELWVNLLV